MTQDPKKRPNWLGKDKNPSGPPPSEPPPSEPPSSAEDAGDDDEMLPPWLRESASPVKRVTPPKGSSGSSTPDWLSGADVEPPKSYKIGGTELPSEYFAAGDQLPDSFDTEMTFDSWMAEQLENRREKDIEEEVPDLLSSIEDDEPATPTQKPKGTGQLPDWFLGLEKLDTSAAPEWFVAEDTPARPFQTGILRDPESSQKPPEPPAKPAPKAAPEPEPDDGGIPDWLSSVRPAEPEPEPEQNDFTDFMNTLGGTLTTSNQFEQDNEIDWYEQPQDLDDLDDSGVPTDDFFSQLVGKAPAAPPPPPPTPPKRSTQQQPPVPPQASYDLPDIDDFEDEDTPASVTIPQNELDAFFDDVAVRHTGSTDEIEALRLASTGTLSTDDFDDPDMGWVSQVEPVEETAPTPPTPREPAVPSADADDWLNQLNNIVSSATRPLRTLSEDDIPADLREAWNSTPAAQSMIPSSTSEDEFDWGEAPSAVEYPIEAPVEEEAPQDDWLNAITAEDDLVVDEPPAETPAPIMTSSLLAGRLRKDTPLPEPEPPSPADEEDIFEPPSLPADMFGAVEAETDDEELIPASELQSGWLTDVFGDEEDAAPEPADESPTEDFFSMLQADADVNLLEDSTVHYDPQASQRQADALSEAEFMNTLGFDSPAEAASEAEEPDFFAHNGMEETPAAPAAPQEDFFANLGFGDDEQPTATQQPQEDFFANLNFGDDEQPTAVPAPSGGWDEQPEDDEEDDFFARLGMEDDEQPLAQEQYAQPAAQEDDFFASLGIEEAQPEDAYELPQTSELYSSFGTEQTPQEDDFFASLAMDEAQPGAAQTYGQEELPQEDDFFASLGMENAQPAAAQAPQADDDFFANLNFGADEEAQPEDTYELPQTSELYSNFGADQTSAAQQEDDFFASLGMSDQTQPAIGEDLPQEDDFFASLNFGDGEQPTTPNPYGRADEALPQEDDFFASLGMSEAVEAIPAAASEEDLFGQWGAQDDELPPEEDLFGEPTSAVDAIPTAASEEGLFGQWDTETADEELPAEDDFYATFNMPPQEAPPTEVDPADLDPADFDPFAQWDRPAETQPTDDFFAALEEMGEDPQYDLPVTGALGEELPQTGSFFASLTENTEPEPEPSTSSFGDIDSYLASLGVETVEEQIANAEFAPEPGEIDFDALFSESALPDTTTETQKMDTLPGANEDWLAELGASVGDVSAGAMVRQKEDRPVEELPDRLRKLRQRAEEIAEEATQPSDAALTPALPGVPSALAASSPFPGGTPAEIVDDVVLLPEQKQKVERLKALIPAAQEQSTSPFRMSAIEATYDTPFMGDLLEDSAESVVVPPKVEEPAPPPRKPRRRLRPRQGPRLDRLLIALLLAVAIILPFYVRDFRLGNLPPTGFTAGSSGQAAYDQINAVGAGDLVLFGMEYSPTSAGELDPMTDALLRHVFMQSAVPVIISSNPLGILRSENLIDKINDDPGFLESIGATDPLVINQDFYVVQYLPGSTIGLRAFSSDSANLLLTDIHGQASNLVIRSLRDFALVALVTDRAEDLRAYAEQIAPLTGAPLVSAVSYGAAPLAQPYAEALGGSLLVGFGDANTYASLLGYVNARPIAERTVFVPSLAPTETPQPTATPLESLTPSRTPTRRASATPSPAPTATPTPLGTGTIISRQAVNMRSGPGTDNAIITAVPSGARVTAIGYNEDQTWVNVRLENGQEGWISASLLSISPQSAAPKPDGFAKRQAIDEGEDDDATATPRAPATRRASATPVPPSATRVPPTATDEPATDAPTDAPTDAAPSATERPPTATRRPPTSTPTTLPSATPTATNTQPPTATDTPSATFTPSMTPIPAIASQIPVLPYRDERWYAINMGIVASVLVITVGAVINILRGLLRRGQRG